MKKTGVWLVILAVVLSFFVVRPAVADQRKSSQRSRDKQHRDFGVRTDPKLQGRPVVETAVDVSDTKEIGIKEKNRSPNSERKLTESSQGNATKNPKDRRFKKNPVLRPSVKRDQAKEAASGQNRTSEESETEGMSLNSLMSKRQQSQQSASNVSKSAHQTQRGIINNMK